MDNHSWKNRDLKIILISSLKLELNLQITCNELGQTVATRTRATGSILGEDQESFKSYSCFQLLMPRATHPSNLISFTPELTTNYLGLYF